MSRRPAGRKHDAPKKPALDTRGRLQAGVVKKKRVVRATIPVGFSRKAIISLRRFRTPAHRRSTQFKQFVWQSRLLALVSLRELSIAIKPHGRKARESRKAHPVLQFFRPILRLSDQAILSFVLLVGGLGGSLYFGTHLKAMPQLFISQSSGAAIQFPRNANLLASELRHHEKVDLIRPVADVQPAPPPQPVLPKVMPRSEPVSIRIPKIQLDTSVIPEGLSPGGAIAMPDVFDQAEWYNQSPTPGERGPAIITGHVDSPHNIAIFWRLRELLPGDIVQVDRQDGTTATFVITDIQQFPQDQFPTETVYGNLDYAGLRLITCGGTFNTLTGHYSHNTVVSGRLAQ